MPPGAGHSRSISAHDRTGREAGAPPTARSTEFGHLLCWCALPTARTDLGEPAPGCRLEESAWGGHRRVKCRLIAHGMHTEDALRNGCPRQHCPQILRDLGGRGRRRPS